MAKANSIGSATGIDVKDFSRLAVEYGKEISTNAFAQADANRIGLHDTQNPYASNPDKLTNFEKALEHITSKSISDDEARREARNNPSLQPFLSLRDLTDESKKKTFQPGSDLEDQFSPQARQDAAEYTRTVGEVNLAWERFVVQVGKPVLETLNNLWHIAEPLTVSFRNFFGALQPYNPLLAALLPIVQVLKS